MDGKLSTLQPNIKEVNLIAKELRRKISFKVHLTYFYIDVDNLRAYEQEQKKLRLKIEVENSELGYKYFWSLPKFVNRYYLIKDLYNAYLESGRINKVAQE